MDHSLPRPMMDADLADPLLGQPLTSDGRYLADWSDCADDAARWRQRVQAAADMLSRRHGNARPVPAADLPCRPPDNLSLVRLHWLGAPFGGARLDLEARSADGQWQPLAVDRPVGALPSPRRAPGTHLDWQWLPADTGTAVDTRFALCDPEPSLAEALRAAGLSVDPTAPRRLWVIDSKEASPRAMFSALHAALADTTRPLLVVTRCAWSLVADEPVAPLHRAAWGLLRVAAIERTDQVIAAVDLADGAAWGELRPALDAFVAGVRWGAVRAGRSHRQQLVAQDHCAPALPPLSLQDDGWHVVTGAFGSLGRLGVQWLVRQGARRIALLAPRAPDDWAEFERALAAPRETRLRWLPCDVGDPHDLDSALRNLQFDGGIRGAIHAAGRHDDLPLAQFDAERLGPLFDITAAAARRLQDWLLAHQGRYLLLGSSTAAVLGAPGQGLRAFATGYLDGLAAQAHARGDSLRVISIGWGALEKADRAADPRRQTCPDRTGMGTLAGAEALWHLDQAVMRGAPYRLAVRLVPERLAEPQRELLGLPSACRDVTCRCWTCRASGS